MNGVPLAQGTHPGPWTARTLEAVAGTLMEGAAPTWPPACAPSPGPGAPAGPGGRDPVPSPPRVFVAVSGARHFPGASVVAAFPTES
ncbi:hypothetical protein QQY24_30480 [Streptomyces sp. TG1A-8]|uniref:hypothetical protein n=1 Tax=Streptomyces sp. TG1A-8 TaxID=3051385 RepID=UPI00265C224C|nr:hypothetical protein [Streptomyces sp. TG1A-8]MDO0929516.1 hypothetical protein [Streptomyces sp. TG1A-8]